MVKLKSSLRKFCGRHHDLIERYKYLCHKWLITGFVTRLTQQVPLVEQELLTLLEHLSSPPVFSRVRVTRSLALCVCFVDRCLSFCPFFFWPLCCLFFFDIRILITPFVSSCMWYFIRKMRRHFPKRNTFAKGN